MCDIIFCCFKQKTAYEVRISDLSSDVCSSDLVIVVVIVKAQRRADRRNGPCRICVTVARRPVACLPEGGHRLYRGLQVGPRHGNGTVVPQSGDRKSVAQGQRVSVRVDLGGRRIIKKHKKKHSLTEKSKI